MELQILARHSDMPDVPRPTSVEEIREWMKKGLAWAIGIVNLRRCISSLTKSWHNSVVQMTSASKAPPIKKIFLLTIFDQFPRRFFIFLVFIQHFTPMIYVNRSVKKRLKMRATGLSSFIRSNQLCAEEIKLINVNIFASIKSPSVLYHFVFKRF